MTVAGTSALALTFAAHATGYLAEPRGNGGQPTYIVCEPEATEVLLRPLETDVWLDPTGTDVYMEPTETSLSFV